MSGKRKIYSKQLKFKAALELASEKYTIIEVSQKYGVHATVLQKWKKELLDKGVDLFDRATKPKSEAKEITGLERKIGQLTMEVDFLKKALGK